MNWQKALLAGVVAGIAVNIVEYIMQGVIMANTYAKYPDVFRSPEEVNPLHLLLVTFCIVIFAAFLFGKTRQCWGDGFKGGATYGLFLGMVFFFFRFYDAIIYEGFPYYLSWCQGGITLIAAVIAGAVMGAIYKAN